MPLPQLSGVTPSSKVAYAGDSTIIGEVVLNPDGSLVGSGGEGGENVTIVGTTPTGNTTSTTTNISTGGTVSAGAISIEFLLSNTFVGTINGATFDNTAPDLVVGAYRLDSPTWKPGSAVVYTISAGRAILTVQT